MLDLGAIENFQVEKKTVKQPSVRACAEDSLLCSG